MGIFVATHKIFNDSSLPNDLKFIKFFVYSIMEIIKLLQIVILFRQIMVMNEFTALIDGMGKI